MPRSIGFTLANGGTAGLFWNFCIAAVGFGFVYASLAELGSMCVCGICNCPATDRCSVQVSDRRRPVLLGCHSGPTQLPTLPELHHRCAFRPVLTCADSQVGYLCAITWQTSVAGTAFVAGTLIQSLFVLNIDSYDPHPWHGTLLTIAFAIVAVIFNTILVRQLPLVEIVCMVVHVLGVVIFIPVLAMAPNRDGGSPMVDFYNQNGWVSNGLATMVATVGPAASLTGLDCSVHMGVFIRKLGYFSYQSQPKRP